MIRRFRSMPLFWKVLVPFMALMLVVGGFGAFLITRTLRERAQTAIDQELARRSLEARATLRDREVSLLETATLAANLDGMARAIDERDAQGVLEFAQSVVALKADLSILVVTDAAGRGIAQLMRTPAGVRQLSPHDWSAAAPIKSALAQSGAGKHAGVVSVSGSPIIAIAAPVCRSRPECSPAGVAFAGVAVADAVAAANVTQEGQRSSVALYDSLGIRLATSGTIASADRIPHLTDAPVRTSRGAGGDETATLYTQYMLQGRSVGRLAVSITTTQALAPVRDAAVRLGLILLAAMAGVVALGALVSRVILAQVRPLVETNRALGSGNLAARTPVLSDDELGELAQGVNKMAEQLQASYETLEARVRERTAEVERLLQERTEFFASISHELRTPLAVIIAQAEVMRDPTHAKTADWTKKTGQAIGESATQLLSLVNDILDVARAETGRLVITLQDTDLAAVFREIRPTAERRARTGEIVMRFDVPSSLVVRADPARIQTVVINLVDNAVKYTPPRGRIRVSASIRPDGMAEIAVADTGIGVPAEVGERIFEPFFRVHGAETQHGEASSGLGLALARRLVEAHGGEISYAANADGGTTFTFTLPVAAPASRPKRAAAKR